MPIQDPSIPNPQVAYPTVYEPLSLGERWGHCLHPNLDSFRLPLATGILVSAVAVFTTAFDGGAGFVLIDGAKFDGSWADDAAAVAALNLIPAFVANYIASTPGANQLRIEALDTKAHTFAGDGVKVVAIASSVTPSGDLYARTGHFVCSSSLLSAAKVPTSMSDTPIGVVCAEGLPSLYELEARGVPKGVLAFPPAYGFLVAQGSEKRVAAVSSDCAMDGIAWAVMTGVNAGTYRKDSGGSGQVTTFTLTPGALNDNIGLTLSGGVDVPLVTVASTGVADATMNKYIAAWKARADASAAATIAKVDATHFTLTSAEGVTFTATKTVSGTADLAQTTVASVAAVAKQTGIPGGGPLITFKQALTAPGRVYVNVGA